MGEAIASYFAAVGIKTRLRTMERAALLSAWRDRKLRGVFVGATGTAGNASTRLEAFATSKGGLAYGAVPEVEALFVRQLQEVDRRKREEAAIFADRQDKTYLLTDRGRAFVGSLSPTQAPKVNGGKVHTTELERG